MKLFAFPSNVNIMRNAVSEKKISALRAQLTFHCELAEEKRINKFSGVVETYREHIGKKWLNFDKRRRVGRRLCEQIDFFQLFMYSRFMLGVAHTLSV